MLKSIKWGILGTGAMAHQFAADLRFVPNATLSSIGSRNYKRAVTFAKSFGNLRPHGTYEELMKDDIDIVYIATPNMRHKEDCILCLENEKAVLCEKPLTLNKKETSEVIATAQKNKKFCMEGMWMCFVPTFKNALKLVKEGAIGNVEMLSASFGNMTTRSPSSRFFNLSMGGGVLMDLGIYPITLAHAVMGTPTQIVGTAKIGITGVDEQISASLQFEGGKIANITASFNTRLTNDAFITGSHGRIHIHAPFYAPTRMTLETFSLPTHLDEDLKKKNHGHLSSKLNQIYRFKIAPKLRRSHRHFLSRYKGNGYQFEAIEATQCVQYGKIESKLLPLEKSLQVAETMEELRKQWKIFYPSENE